MASVLSERRKRAQAVHFPWAEVDWSLTLDRSDGLAGWEAGNVVDFRCFSYDPSAKLASKPIEGRIKRIDVLKGASLHFRVDLEEYDCSSLNSSVD